MSNRNARRGIVIGALALLGAAGVSLSQEKKPDRWVKLETEGGAGKQDDIFFVDSERGWYVNGLGNIWKTKDAGRSWKRVVHRKGTYFRCLGFVDPDHGLAGNVGPGYFPG